MTDLLLEQLVTWSTGAHTICWPGVHRTTPLTRSGRYISPELGLNQQLTIFNGWTHKSSHRLYNLTVSCSSYRRYAQNWSNNLYQLSSTILSLKSINSYKPSRLTYHISTNRICVIYKREPVQSIQYKLNQTKPSPNLIPNQSNLNQYKDLSIIFKSPP